MTCTAAHLRSCLLNIASLSGMIEGSYRSWDLYTIGQLVDGLQKKKKRKPVFLKWKWNHVIFSRVKILSFHPVFSLHPLYISKQMSLKYIKHLSQLLLESSILTAQCLSQQNRLQTHRHQHAEAYTKLR